jgi:molybdopterin molybdotransferase
VLAAEVGATDPVPGFDNSAMDGFAVRAADTAGATAEAPLTLDVVDESRAGRPAERGVPDPARPPAPPSTGSTSRRRWTPPTVWSC